jgi:hypothetical protein
LVSFGGEASWGMLTVALRIWVYFCITFVVEFKTFLQNPSDPSNIHLTNLFWAYTKCRWCLADPIKI